MMNKGTSSWKRKKINRKKKNQGEGEEGSSFAEEKNGETGQFTGKASCRK